MGSPQFIEDGSGGRMVVLREQDYNALLERLADYQDIELADEVVARGGESFPDSVAEALLNDEPPVRVFREYRGVRANELAERAGISGGYLSQIESGKRVGSAETLKRIAEALEVDVDLLIG